MSRSDPPSPDALLTEDAARAPEIPGPARVPDLGAALPSPSPGAPAASRPDAARRVRRSGSTAARDASVRSEPSPLADDVAPPIRTPRNTGVPPAGDDGYVARPSRRGAHHDELPTFEEEAAPSSEAPTPRARRHGAGPEPSRHQVRFSDHLIDQDAVKVVRRLVRNGYEAYLVGGCVRDLLLNRTPKDFDVATSARPEQVRALFKNSRVIGRRFRLVHVLFHGGKVIEVATYRRNPKDESDEPEAGARKYEEQGALLIRSDNLFGVAHEDAERRDFTINGLFYDVDNYEILDWVGGMDDVRRREVHTIGDPEVRFHEDPVRILRALKFAGRLDLGIAPEVYDAIVLCRRQLELAARPRLSEEILRLLRGGAARRTIYLAWETGVLDELLPELSSLLYDGIEEGTPGYRVFRHLAHADRRAQEGVVLDDAALWTLLLLEPLKEACDGARDRGAAAADFLEPVLERLAVPRRFVEIMRRVMAILPRVAAGKGGRYARGEFFDTALEVAAADLAARGESTGRLDALRAAEREADAERPDEGDRRPPRRGDEPVAAGAPAARRRSRTAPRR
jgi:poly(A) polymerase